MMKRAVLITVVVVAIAAAAFAFNFNFNLDGRGGLPSRQDTAAPAADSVWYHASDVAMLARTGRPQLVEFFHPG
ncbi:MAG: hypothetical protein ACRENI_04675 [Gemmatimonadaceae bacterium]